MIVVFLGPPGSGKGTQAEILKDRFGFLHFDTGAQLRAEVATGSDLGQRIADVINTGKLVSLPMIKELILKFMRSTDAPRILFDGFPRNLEQAAVLDEGLLELGDDLDFAVYMEIDSDRLLERIVNRRYCTPCGAIYNLKTEPPKNEGVCDECGAALTQRKDDTAEVFGTRLEVYLKETVPLLDLYRGRGLLSTVDAELSVEEITARLAELLGVEALG